MSRQAECFLADLVQGERLESLPRNRREAVLHIKDPPVPRHQLGYEGQNDVPDQFHPQYALKVLYMAKAVALA